MQTFEYRGRNQHGDFITGTTESTSANAVAQWLRETDIFPIHISPLAPSWEPPAWLRQRRADISIPATELMLFTRQMANMVRVGLPLLEAIAGIQKSTGNKTLAKVLQAACDDLDRGLPLSTSLARHPGIFGEYYVSMVRVGEGTGQLREAFEALHKQIEFDRKMRQKIKSAFRYPSFVLVAMAVAISVLTLFVLPTFGKTYANLRVELPLLTQILMGTSRFAVQYWWLMLIFAGLSFFIGQRFVRAPEGRYLWDKYKLRAPVIGSILSKATVARFSRSFATANKAGVPLVKTFDLVSRVVDNAFFEERIQRMRQGVERGEPLSKVMRMSGLFTPLELQSITVAESTGDVNSAVEQLAMIYQEDVEYSVSRLSQTIEPLLLAGLGILVGILMLGIFLPMWDLGQASFGGRRP